MPPSIVASLIFLVVPLTLFHRCGAAASNTTYVLQYKDCPTSGNLSRSAGSGSISGLYQQNLLQFLATLPSNAINNSGFFNGTAGSTTAGKVFGMAMCQADIPWPDQCDSCLQAASAEAPKACPSSSNANIAYRGCVLRYSDAPILAVANDNVANGYAFYTQVHAAGVPDTARFGEARNELFTDLASAAAISPLMIASGNRTFNGTHNMYGLAQCNRELPRELCSYMISSIVQGIPDFMTELQWSEGVSITGFSFYIRYDLTPFGVYVPPTGSDHPQTITVTGGLVQKVAIPVSISIIILLVLFIVIKHYQKKWKIAHILKVTDMLAFSYGDIWTATGNFSDEKLLGEGGFGKVYKGTFRVSGSDYQDLAVKCVTDNNSARKQLLDELMMLAGLQHMNVVKLKGFCSNDGWFKFGKRGRGLYVCNEFFSEGSLDRHIFASTNNAQVPLDWDIRYQIIRGICAGLQYLHEQCNKTIAHMDLKPSNILLDQQMVPKIADFGLSRAFVNAKTHTYTTTVIGTNGYMAPELTERNEDMSFKVGRKCDIYSLGVLILAIVMGHGPVAMRDPGGVVFIRKVRQKFSPPIDWKKLKRDAPWLDDDCLENVERCVGLAFECVADDPDRRPLATELYSRLPAPAAGT